MKRLIKSSLLLAIVYICLFGYVLACQSSIFREFQAALLLADCMLLVCLAVWCSTFLFLTFSWKDWPLISLLLIVIGVYFIENKASSRSVDAVILFAGVTLGRAARFFLSAGSRHEEKLPEKAEDSQSILISAAKVLVVLVVMLAFASWWHLDVAQKFYPGTRWTGFWNNPNIYGMLMAAGVALSIGLLAAYAKLRVKNSKTTWLLRIAAFMMGLGLVMSYSRGAWVATSVALPYLAWSYGNLKWRYMLPMVLAAAAIIALFWHSTAATAPWYLKRLDLSRPSTQHRVSAWRGAIQMMRDHPLGVGWNHAVELYAQKYSPPEGSAAAITMNSYLLLGTECGLPGLLCFVVYVGLVLKGDTRLKLDVRKQIPYLTLTLSPRSGIGEGIGITCRAGVAVFLVAFWFDGGLFDLPTAAVFWVLLELGASNVAPGKEPGSACITTELDAPPKTHDVP